MKRVRFFEKRLRSLFSFRRLNAEPKLLLSLQTESAEGSQATARPTRSAVMVSDLVAVSKAWPRLLPLLISFSFHCFLFLPLLFTFFSVSPFGGGIAYFYTWVRLVWAEEFLRAEVFFNVPFRQDGSLFWSGSRFLPPRKFRFLS